MYERLAKINDPAVPARYLREHVVRSICREFNLIPPKLPDKGCYAGWLINYARADVSEREICRAIVDRLG